MRYLSNVLKFMFVLVIVLWSVTRLNATKDIKEVKPFFKRKAPYVFAHRGGAGIAPEHTPLAFKKAEKIGVDGFEIDIRLTKDEEIVVHHDAFVDRTSNGAGRVSEKTMDELRALDYGYHFKEADGSYPYRGHSDSKIMTLRELIETHPDKLINIDIKDEPESVAGELVVPKLYRLINETESHDRVLVTSFYQEQIEKFKTYAEDRVATGAGVEEVRKAVVLYQSGFGHCYSGGVDTFQLPTSYNGYRLDGERFIQFLKERNIVVGYWTINDMDEMNALIEKGAHTIVTDFPDMSAHLYHEK